MLQKLWQNNLPLRRHVGIPSSRRFQASLHPEMQKIEKMEGRNSSQTLNKCFFSSKVYNKIIFFYFFVIGDGMDDSELQNRGSFSLCFCSSQIGFLSEKQKEKARDALAFRASCGMKNRFRLGNAFATQEGERCRT